MNMLHGRGKNTCDSQNASSSKTKGNEEKGSAEDIPPAAPPLRGHSKLQSALGHLSAVSLL